MPPGTKRARGALPGVDKDNGGEFLNRRLVAHSAVLDVAQAAGDDPAELAAARPPDAA